MSATVLRGITLEEYHADPCERPSLSQSIATTLLTRSPLHAWLEHPRLGGVGLEPTKAMENGTLLHSLIFGSGPEVVAVDALDWRTKDARAQRDEARAAGKVPVLEHVYAETRAVATAIQARLGAFGIDLAGESELMVTWTEESERGPVLCRAMLDHVVIEGGRATVYDLKTTRDAHPTACSRRSAEMGHDVQAAAYTRAVGKVHPSLVGRVDFVFLFAETAPPYCVTPMRPGGLMRDWGEARWLRAVETWAQCLATETWPGYVSGVVALDPPPWAVSQDAAFMESTR